MNTHREKITKIREEMEEAAKAEGKAEDEIFLSSREIYDKAGAIPGVQVKDDYHLDIVMDHPYPQILYWLAMSFAAAVPHEAVDMYQGHPNLWSQLVDTGMRQDWTGNASARSCPRPNDSDWLRMAKGYPKNRCSRNTRGWSSTSA